MLSSIKYIETDSSKHPYI